MTRRPWYELFTLLLDLRELCPLQGYVKHQPLGTKHKRYHRKKTRGLKDDGHHYFKELIVNSDNLIHVFLRGEKSEERVLAVICRKSANMGMVLTKSRSMMGVVEAAA